MRPSLRAAPDIHRSEERKRVLVREDEKCDGREKKKVYTNVHITRITSEHNTPVVT